VTSATRCYGDEVPGEGCVVREGNAVGSILAALGSLVIGGAVATATVVGVVQSQTAAPDESPVSVNAPVEDLVAYGSD
jgi:hypothetical protein